MHSDRTYVSHNERTAPGRKAEEAIITFLAWTNTTGEHKIKLLIMGRAKKPRSFKAYKLLVEYRNSKSAWMTVDIFGESFHQCYVPQVQWITQLKSITLLQSIFVFIVFRSKSFCHKRIYNKKIFYYMTTPLYIHQKINCCRLYIRDLYAAKRYALDSAHGSKCDSLN